MNRLIFRGKPPLQEYHEQARATEEMIQQRGAGIIEMAEEVAALLEFTEDEHNAETYLFIRPDREVVYSRSDQDMSEAFEPGEEIQVITIGQCQDDDLEDEDAPWQTYAHITRPFELSLDDLSSGESLIDRINGVDSLMISKTGIGQDVVEVGYSYDGAQGFSGSRWKNTTLKVSNFDLFHDILKATTVQLLTGRDLDEANEWTWLEPQPEIDMTVKYDPTQHGPYSPGSIPLDQIIRITDVPE